MTPVPETAWPGALIGADQLARSLGTEGLVVLDASVGPHRHKGPWIPGARIFDIDGEMSDHGVGLPPHTRPIAEQFAALLRALGVRRADRVVVYDAVGIYSCARAWWMLRAAGFEQVAVLDGGLPGWLAAGHPVEEEPGGGGQAVRTDETSAVRRTAVQEPSVQKPSVQGRPVREPAVQKRPVQEPAVQKRPVREPSVQERPVQEPFVRESPVRRPSVPEARERPGAFVARADVEAALADGTSVVLDARSRGRFAGTEPEPRAGLRGGHMPGAVNLPFGELQDGHGRMRPPAELRTLFEEAAGADRPLVVSCGSGVTACVLALGAELAGRTDVSVYDGSWSEWGVAGSGTPVVRGEGAR